MVALIKNSEVRKQAFELFKAGDPLVEISRKLDIPEGTIRSWKSRYKWDATLQQDDATKNCNVAKKKRGAPLQNKNAEGHDGSNAGAPKRNTNAEKHGLFSKYFTDDTKDIYESLVDSDPLALLWHNIMFMQAELLRSQKIMYVKDQNDKTIEKVGYTEGKTVGETWEVQQAWDKQASYIKAVARIEAELRNMIKDYLELEGQSSAEAKAEAKDWKTAIIEIAKRRRGDQHD